MSNINVIVIHGAYGYPQENWFDWLRQALHQLDVVCHVPQLPTPANQTLSTWIRVFNQSHSKHIHANTLFVGHSLGAIFILIWLEQHVFHCKTVILVGAFLDKIGNKKFDAINQSFFQANFNWSAIKKKSDHFVCYDSDDDPYITQIQFNEITNNLNA